MKTQKSFHALADDTALVANISEIKKWLAQGNLSLIIPVYTLERLHLLKRDHSQVGNNAREAVKFLDRVTSGKDNIPESSIQLQGPTDQYETWEEVEAQLNESAHNLTPNTTVAPADPKAVVDGDKSGKAASASRSTNALSQMLLDKLNFAKEPETASQASTPPTSPSSSNMQSVKTSPEISSVKPINGESKTQPADGIDPIIVPHSYRPLINSAVYLLKNQMTSSPTLREVFMLTNDADTATIARKFGLNVKNIHQLRSVMVFENQEVKNQSKYHQKHSPKSSITAQEPKAKTLFSYEEDDEDDDEVVFRPRSGKPVTATRQNNTKVKPETRKVVEATVPPPPIPTEEIDPDSFDRGAFARPRPTTPNRSNNTHNTNGNHWHSGRNNTRGSTGQHSTRGAGRGNSRGSGRGSSRGKGKLFVP